MHSNIPQENVLAAMRFQHIGLTILRYGLALVLIWIGLLKFTAYESDGIKGLVSNSPFLSWTYPIFGVQGFSNVLGIVEIGSGLLICCRTFIPRLSAWGSILAGITFLTTLTFLLSTPGIIQEGYGFPFISPMPGQFILKDVVLLGASVWTATEAWQATVVSAE